MSYTRRDWAVSYLHGLWNLNPDEKTIEWVVAWTMFETATGANAAQYNLLNTTEPNTPGVVSDFNSAGVKNYDTFEHGIAANVKVTENGYYPTTLSLLRANSIVNANENQVLGVNKELTTWGTGSKYGEILSIMGQGLSDTFPGNKPIVSVIDELWTQWISDISTNTGIYTSWKMQPNKYGSPLTRENHMDAHSMIVIQEFERSTCFWVNGNAHWRVY